MRRRLPCLKVKLDSRRWRSVRKLIIKRDKKKCRWCGRRGKDVHHIIKKSSWRGRKLAYTTSNLILLCHQCHLKTYGKEEKFEGLFFSMLGNGHTPKISRRAKKRHHLKSNTVERRNKPIKFKIQKQKKVKHTVRLKR